MRAVFLIFTFAIAFDCSAQIDTIWLADYKQLEKSIAGKEKVHVIFFNQQNKKILSEGNYIAGKEDGPWAIYDSVGKVRRMESYKLGIKNGVCFIRSGGHFERKEQYVDGKMVEGHCFDTEGKEIPYFKETLTYAEHMPRAEYDYNAYIKTHFNYPESSKENQSKSRVFVKFIVEEDGKIQDVTVLRGIDSAVDAEVSRVVANMPPWKPGKNGEEKVPVYFTIPVDIR